MLAGTVPAHLAMYRVEEAPTSHRGRLLRRWSAAEAAICIPPDGRRPHLQLPRVVFILPLQEVHLLEQLLLMVLELAHRSGCCRSRPSDEQATRVRRFVHTDSKLDKLCTMQLRAACCMRCTQGLRRPITINQVVEDGARRSQQCCKGRKARA